MLHEGILIFTIGIGLLAGLLELPRKGRAQGPGKVR